MNSDELLKNERIIRKEADDVLAALQLVPYLAKQGEVEIGGSYEYKVMVDRDIDLGLAISALDRTNNTKTRESIGSFILARPFVTKLKIVDYIAVPPPPGKPHGIWFGITVLFNQHEWSIDLWATRSNEKFGILDSNGFRAQLPFLPDSTRATILALKNHVHREFPRTYHSIAIYEAVIEHNIQDIDRLMTYLKQRQGARRPEK